MAREARDRAIRQHLDLRARQALDHIVLQFLGGNFGVVEESHRIILGVVHDLKILAEILHRHG